MGINLPGTCRVLCNIGAEELEEGDVDDGLDVVDGCFHHDLIGFGGFDISIDQSDVVQSLISLTVVIHEERVAAGATLPDIVGTPDLNLVADEADFRGLLVSQEPGQTTVGDDADFDVLIVLVVVAVVTLDECLGSVGLFPAVIAVRTTAIVLIILLVGDKCAERQIEGAGLHTGFDSEGFAIRADRDGICKLLGDGVGAEVEAKLTPALLAAMDGPGLPELDLLAYELNSSSVLHVMTSLSHGKNVGGLHVSKVIHINYIIKQG